MSKPLSTAIAIILSTTRSQYPANVQKVNACQVYTNGDYVFFIMLAVIPDELLDDADEQAEYDYCIESNQKAIDAIDALLG